MYGKPSKRKENKDDILEKRTLRYNVCMEIEAWDIHHDFVSTKKKSRDDLKHKHVTKGQTAHWYQGKHTLYQPKFVTQAKFPLHMRQAVHGHIFIVLKNLCLHTI